MSDKEMDRLPERSALGEPGVDRKTTLRTLLSGIVADAGRLLRGLRGKLRRR